MNPGTPAPELQIATTDHGFDAGSVTNLKSLRHSFALLALQCGDMFDARRLLAGMATCTVALSVGSAAVAAETAVFSNAPAGIGIAPVRFAGQFELKLHLPQGRGLARLLIDAGVDKEDAAATAKLAAGRMGDDQNGCFATVSVERAADGVLKLVRIMVTTDEQRTVIERRGASLAIASETAVVKHPRLI